MEMVPREKTGADRGWAGEDFAEGSVASVDAPAMPWKQSRRAAEIGSRWREVIMGVS